VNQCQVIFQRLNQIGLNRILEQRRHRSMSLQIPRIDGRLPIKVVAHDDPPQTLLEVLKLCAKHRIAMTSDATTIS